MHLPRVILLLFVIGCSGVDGLSSGSNATSVVASVHSYADTIQASIGVPLTVTVTKDGRPAAGTPVTFLTTFKDSYFNSVLFTSSTATENSLTVATDASGHASVRVRLGTENAKIWVEALGVRDTVDVVVSPGQATYLKLGGARDTTVYVGTSVSHPIAEVIDRAFHPLTVTPAWTSRRTDIGSADATGLTARALSVGRVWFIAKAGSATDSVALSVVPHATLAAHSALKNALFSFELDGSAYRQWTPTRYFEFSSPRWTASGGLIMQQQVSATQAAHEIVSVDAAGTMTRLAGAAPGFVEVLQPDPMPNGAGMTVVMSNSNQQKTEIWKVDGAGVATRVGQPQLMYEPDLLPAMSPDGKRIALLSGRGVPNDGRTIQLLDVATGAQSNTGVPAESSPRWSPDGRQLAYVVGRTLEVLTLSSMTRRTLSSLVFVGSVLGPLGDGQVEWSPDGAWIVGCIFGHASERYLVMVNAQSGEVMPLEFSRRDGLCQPAWKR